ncbi:hypothetical protein MERGE_000417 [Pneumocystis wakefieldiae]|uniref:Proline--tRNA ligase n=1 Tax=Pneumocystis wakefieldiae TaxID=38082 RepID=A0A899FR51_9ASCO|nr:hypothetical protein MERGE_000417 [Pneumocystis wakefieldiae]
MAEKDILYGLSCLSISDRYIISHEEAPSELLWKKNVEKQAIFDKYLLIRVKLLRTGRNDDQEFKLVFVVALEDSKIDFSYIASVLNYKSLDRAQSELISDFFGVKSQEVSLFSLTRENISKIHLVLDSRILLKTELLAFRLSCTKTVFITRDQLLKYLVDLDVKRTDIDLSSKPKSSVQSKGSLSSKNGMQEGALIGITVKKKDNFSEWYRQVLIKGNMEIQKWFDAEIKKMGVEGCYFPMFVSSKILEKEKDHIEGFAPEVAWITKAGDSNLEEPIAIRPTSETIMYSYYSKWIRSHRDLPLKLNQWNSVVRWEFKHPQPFLRTREFLWQEGHTAYLDRKESEKEVFEILDLYEKVYLDLLAVPVIKGIKSENEKFAGAAFTATIEGYIPACGRAIQAGTSHSLGQNFSKMFDICVENPDTKVAGEKSKIYVWQNSWGLSTRAIGIMIMTHGDDKGLVIPPRVSKIQVIVIPCGITVKTTNSEQKLIQDGVENIVQELKKVGIRADSDTRTLYSPGWKFSHWEMMGVPLRLEYGLRDHKASQVIAARRDTGIKFTIPLSTLSETVSELLTTIQSDLYKKAKRMYDENIEIVYKWDDFVLLLNKKKVLLAPWCKVSTCEEEIRKKSSNESNIESEEESLLTMGAKSLCIPLEQPSGEHLLKEGITRCIACDNFAKIFALFGHALFCLVILLKIPYTEIDWNTYMTQVSIYLSGERNYVNIKGDTGPIVYPSGFLYLYSLLYKLTDGGRDIARAQYIFMLVYLSTLFFIFKIYQTIKAPLYTYFMLIFSKRLHSIYLLRLFNDCWAMLFSYIGIYAYVQNLWTLGTFFFAIALGIKMNVLLFFPAIAIILFQILGLRRTLYHFLLIFGIQTLLFIPFISYKKEYISRAFDFSHVFLYEWSVNWKFLSEDVFFSKKFSFLLLFIHILTLFVFSSTLWNRISGRSLKELVLSLLNTKALFANKVHKTSFQTQRLIVIILFTSNLIGVLCARSLHYQFYSWFAWTIPYILSRTRIHPFFQFFIFALQEYAWNIYPSTFYSSIIVVMVLASVLFLLLIRC